MKKILLLLMAILLVGCKDQASPNVVEIDEVVDEINNEEATNDETSDETSDEVKRDVKEELEWIAQNNVNLHSPSDDMAKIVDYNTEKPIGVSIYYDLKNGFDNNRYQMNIKFGEDQGQFELGWQAQNAHEFRLKNNNPVNSVRENENREDFITPSTLMIDKIYGTTDDYVFSDYSYVQITAADVDSDNELEIILYANAPSKWLMTM